MASIVKYKLSSGWTVYRVFIRRKGLKGFSVRFNTEEEAKEWVKNNEFEYIKNPRSYEKFMDEKNRLQMKREREEERLV